MATKGTQIVDLDVEKLIEELNKALADEWLAYYQYWVSAKVVHGLGRQAVTGELNEHAGDELRHAEMLTERIIQLGGIPILNPNDWSKKANCAYLEPKDHSIEAILKQSIAGERCAIDVYNKMMDKTRNKDELTYYMLLKILQDEVDHEDDFEALLADLKN